MERTGKAEYLIQETGCSPFQVWMVLLVYVVGKIPAAFSMMFMSFGNYDPGWRCLDNYTSNSQHNDTDNVLDNLMMNTNTTLRYSHGSCQVFKACQHVEFDPETSTIVTEWGLLCDKAWIPSLIISVQMSGLMVGAFISGQLGDSFGRKKILYSAIALCGVLNALMMFVQSWQMFLVLRFLIGLTLACIVSLYYVLPSEFLTTKWRGRMAAIPAWHVGGVMFAVTAMIYKDWKIIHLVSGAICLACCVSVIWVPESLRWLEVKNKHKQFERVAKKMIAMSNKPNSVNLLHQNGILVVPKEDNIGVNHAQETVSEHRYTLLDLFRKGYRLYSIIITIIYISCSLIYYAISFGVKSMYGDFYINLIIIYAIEIPLSIFPIYAPNLLGRKLSCIIFLGLTTICLLIVAGFELWAAANVKYTGTLVLALVAKTAVDGAWYILMTLTAELYPTVVRSIGINYGSLSARFGGIMVPFLIPQDADTVYICYAVMGGFGLLCCLLLTKLPETRGKKLKETFDVNYVD